MAFDPDTQLGMTTLGPSPADVDYVLAIHALGGSAVPSAEEREKIEEVKAQSLSVRFTAVCDAVLARS